MLRPFRTHRTVAVLLAAGSLPLAGQQQLPPVRLLTIQARATEALGAVSTAVPLPGGKVLVNDILRRRVVMFDSTLAHATVVADSTSATANAYGARGGGLLSYHGDSALFIDPASLSMTVVNANGELAGVKAVPRANEVVFLMGGPNGRPGFDAQGRMIYRGFARPRPAAADARPTVGNFVMPEQPDSAPVVRVDLETRTLDTLAMVKIPRTIIKVTQGNDGRMNVQTTMNPLPVTDDWALLSDGTIAVVRGHDFHVDWVGADRNVTSSPKIPFEWQRLSDDDKQMVLDSARAAIERQRDEAMRLMQAGGGPVAFINGGGAERMIAVGAGGGAAGGAGGGTAGAAAGERRRQGTVAGEGGRGGPGGPGVPGGGPGGFGAFQPPTINMVPPSELPDYRPPFGQQSALGDRDGNLWVRTSLPVGGDGPIYFVIDRDGNVVDRVQVPQGRIVTGFGRGGVVYLGFRDAEGNAYLETARWK